MTNPSLRAFRLDLRPAVTLAEVSRKTGIDPSTLTKLEAGKREATYSQVSLLAMFYGARCDRLVRFGEIAQMLAVGAGYERG